MPTRCVRPLARAASVLLACALAACSVRREVRALDVGPERTFAELDANVLDAGKLSASTRGTLQLLGLEELFELNPIAALRELHKRVLHNPQRELVFALAEASYGAGEMLERPDCFLAAAVYAYAYLFGQEDPAPANPFDRRFRWACDLYNQGLLRAFASVDHKSFELTPGERALPTGRLTVRVDRTPLPRELRNASGYLPADRYVVRGLRLRVRESGVGVPLIGLYPLSSAPGAKVDAEVKERPLTAFLRVEGSLADLARGVPAVLELYSSDEPSAVAVGGRSVPLEADSTTALAHTLDRPAWWDFSVTGFFSNERASSVNRLLAVHPHQSGRIPVVFVHGTASSPAYWAELINSLRSDAEIRHRMDFWFFQYATGNPLPYSAAALREALTATVAELDPLGQDPAMREMVVIGHSQGGLLVKLIVVDGSLHWIEEVLGTPLEKLGFSPEDAARVARMFDFRALPFVKRVVFVATPHRGSFHAERWYSRLIRKLIEIPGEVARVGERLTAGNERLPPGLRDSIPTSIDSMKPSNPFLQLIARTSVPPGVHVHSIIPIGDANASDPDALAAADDGVVEYKSAHLDGVESEKLIPSGHSCQTHPATIEEIRRILREHLRSSHVPRPAAAQAARK